MKQQINLYLTLPNKSRFFLTEKLITQVCFSFILFLFAISIYQHISIESKTGKVAILQQLLITQTQEFARASQRQMAMAQTGNTTANLQHEIATKEVLLHILSKQSSPGTCQVPSDYFLQLAHNETPGLWLQTIGIDISSRNIRFTGISLQPELVMQFMQSLQDEKCFHGKQFNTVKLLKSDSEIKNGGLIFTLSTTASESQ